MLLICLREGESSAAMGRIARALELPDESRLQRWRWHEPGLLCVGVSAEEKESVLERLLALDEVERVLSSESSCRGERQVVALPNGASFGAGLPPVIAGPCSVEDRSRTLEIAHAVKEAGADAFRGGAFKARTSPYSFGGPGEEGLEVLSLAREETGLPIVTEAIEAEQLDLVARHADVIQIGSRNMHNYSLLFRAGCHPAGKPVLLKRGLAATLDELVLAAEYVVLGRRHAGHQGAGALLCERGIRTFDTNLRFTLDVGAIPVLQEMTDLPVVVDPSHAAGARRYVPALLRAAVAAGAEGVIVEAHTEPDCALCDGVQSIEIETLERLVRQVRLLSELD